LLAMSPKQCHTLPGNRYLLGINFDTIGKTSLVYFVRPKSPADKAGIKPGERILSINGISVSDFDDIGRAMPVPLSPAEPVSITTDVAVYTITAALARVEQCDWDTRDSNAIKVGDHDYVDVYVNDTSQAFFRTTCRIIDDYVVACSTDSQS
jgi:predicted metalloprotease with PDZ domain